MAVITQTAIAGITDLVRTTLSASDTLTYVANSGQVLELANNTGGSLTAVIKGTAPSATFPVAGSGGTTVDLSAGKSIVMAAGKTFRVSLDSIASYLVGTGSVTVTGAATAVATLVA
jgi:hypothetical protein